MSQTSPNSANLLPNKLQLPQVGTIAPTFTLPATDGGQIDLEQYPKPVALVFLRHLA